jgi:hypothetical protein
LACVDAVIVTHKQTLQTRNIQQTDTAEMKNFKAKRKSESDIKIFKDCLSTVGELRNLEDIVVEEINMHLENFLFSAHEIKTGLRT